MKTTARKPGSKYMPTYDYSQVGNWSMSSEEANAILDEASRLWNAGDEEGYYRVSKKLPLPPNMALEPIRLLSFPFAVDASYFDTSPLRRRCHVEEQILVAG